MSWRIYVQPVLASGGNSVLPVLDFASALGVAVLAAATAITGCV